MVAANEPPWFDWSATKGTSGGGGARIGGGAGGADTSDVRFVVPVNEARLIVPELDEGYTRVLRLVGAARDHTDCVVPGSELLSVRAAQARSGRRRAEKSGGGPHVCVLGYTTSTAESMALVPGEEADRLRASRRNK